MLSKWYIILVIQDSDNRYAIKWGNGSWVVIDYSAGLHVLDLHNEAKAFDFSIKDILTAEEQNHNAGYIFIRNQEAE